MRCLLQRVRAASVEVGGQKVAGIGPGLLAFVCAMPADDVATAERLARKVTQLRIFRDAEERMNLSVADTGGEVLVVSQFTLAADTSRGNRPGYSGAAAPDIARPLVDAFIRAVAARGIAVQPGVFGADMLVRIENDGPVTIWLEN